jgi:hypothetical protein
MPIHEDYHAIERAVYSASLAGCNTIWVVLHRETQPIIRKKLGDWVYDPEHVWKGYNHFLNKLEIPVYYVAIRPVDKNRRDSFAWSSLYGARMATKAAIRISKWLHPQRYLVVSPYGVVADETMLKARELIRGDKNLLFRHRDRTFLGNTNMPFTFDNDDLKTAHLNFKSTFTGEDTERKWSDIFGHMTTEGREIIDMDWYYNIIDWNRYAHFIGSKENNKCRRPKFMVTHKWRGFV